MPVYQSARWRDDNRQPRDFSGWLDPTVGRCTLFGLTFEGIPFYVELTSNSAFDHGASAGIYKGQCLGPWSQPIAVAVKVYGQMLRPVQQELLVRELRMASQVSLRHPFILPFLGTADVGEQQSLVSLYMQNGNVLEYLKAHQGCDKKKLILQVAEAVNYLHTDVRLVHGDLKCANVLISDFGDALLADFGLSTFMEKSQFAETTMTGIRDMHTARFAAPELLLGTDDPSSQPRSKTRESDVYAFGMLILEAATELPPWSNQATLSVIQKVCQGHQPSQPTSRGFVSISHPWWDVCKSCWSFDPADRSPMHEVLSALEETELNPHRRISGYRAPILSVAYVSSGPRVVSGSGDRIRIWASLTGRSIVSPAAGPGHDVLAVAISPDGDQICSAGDDGTVRRWDAESGAPLGTPMAGHRGDVNVVAYSLDGTQIVSAGHDCTLRLWDAYTGEALAGPLEGHQKLICTVRLWDSASGAMLAALQHDWAVLSVCFSPNGMRLVSGSVDRAVRIWDTRTQQLERTICGHSDVVMSLAVSPSGRYIASGSRDKTIRIWNSKTGDAVGAPLSGHTDCVRWVVFSPDGRTLSSGSWDNTARVWDLFE